LFWHGFITNLIDAYLSLNPKQSPRWALHNNDHDVIGHQIVSGDAPVVHARVLRVRSGGQLVANRIFCDLVARKQRAF